MREGKKTPPVQDVDMVNYDLHSACLYPYSFEKCIMDKFILPTLHVLSSAHFRLVEISMLALWLIHRAEGRHRAPA